MAAESNIMGVMRIGGGQRGPVTKIQCDSEALTRFKQQP